jgi:hypothetical protein
VVFLGGKIALACQTIAQRLAKDFFQSMLISFVLGCLLTSPLSRADQPAQEYAVKAAYLYNFAKFVQWPLDTFASENSPIRLCVIGDDPFSQALDVIVGKKVRNHPLTVHNLPFRQMVTKNNCNIFFISQSEKEHVEDLLAVVSYTPVLTVSDIRGFADAGGMIGLVNIGQRIRFEINVLAVRQANLEISSQLLKLARIIDN